MTATTGWPFTHHYRVAVPPEPQDGSEPKRVLTLGTPSRRGLAVTVTPDTACNTLTITQVETGRQVTGPIWSRSPAGCDLALQALGHLAELMDWTGNREAVALRWRGIRPHTGPREEVLRFRESAYAVEISGETSFAALSAVQPEVWFMYRAPCRDGRLVMWTEGDEWRGVEVIPIHDGWSVWAIGAGGEGLGYLDGEGAFAPDPALLSLGDALTVAEDWAKDPLGEALRSARPEPDEAQLLATYNKVAEGLGVAQEWCSDGCWLEPGHEGPHESPVF
jgi:hypothetical protein